MIDNDLVWSPNDTSSNRMEERTDNVEQGECSLQRRCHLGSSPDDQGCDRPGGNDDDSEPQDGMEKCPQPEALLSELEKVTKHQLPSKRADILHPLLYQIRPLRSRWTTTSDSHLSAVKQEQLNDEKETGVGVRSKEQKLKLEDTAEVGTPKPIIKVEDEEAGQPQGVQAPVTTARTAEQRDCSFTVETTSASPYASNSAGSKLTNRAKQTLARLTDVSEQVTANGKHSRTLDGADACRQHPQNDHHEQPMVSPASTVATASFGSPSTSATAGAVDAALVSPASSVTTAFSSSSSESPSTSATASAVAAAAAGLQQDHQGQQEAQQSEEPPKRVHRIHRSKKQFYLRNSAPKQLLSQQENSKKQPQKNTHNTHTETEEDGREEKPRREEHRELEDKETWIPQTHNRMSMLSSACGTEELQPNGDMAEGQATVVSPESRQPRPQLQEEEKREGRRHELNQKQRFIEEEDGNNLFRVQESDKSANRSSKELSKEVSGASHRLTPTSQEGRHKRRREDHEERQSPQQGPGQKSRQERQHQHPAPPPARINQVQQTPSSRHPEQRKQQEPKGQGQWTNEGQQNEDDGDDADEEVGRYCRPSASVATATSSGKEKPVGTTAFRPNAALSSQRSSFTAPSPCLYRPPPPVYPVYQPFAYPSPYLHRYYAMPPWCGFSGGFAVDPARVFQKNRMRIIESGGSRPASQVRKSACSTSGGSTTGDLNDARSKTMTLAGARTAECKAKDVSGSRTQLKHADDAAIHGSAGTSSSSHPQHVRDSAGQSSAVTSSANSKSESTSVSSNKNEWDQIYAQLLSENIDKFSVANADQKKAIARAIANEIVDLRTAGQQQRASSSSVSMKHVQRMVGMIFIDLVKQTRAQQVSDSVLVGSCSDSTDVQVGNDSTTPQTSDGRSADTTCSSNEGEQTQGKKRDASSSPRSNTPSLEQADLASRSPGSGEPSMKKKKKKKEMMNNERCGNVDTSSEGGAATGSTTVKNTEMHANDNNPDNTNTSAAAGIHSNENSEGGICSATSKATTNAEDCGKKSTSTKETVCSATMTAKPNKITSESGDSSERPSTGIYSDSNNKIETLNANTATAKGSEIAPEATIRDKECGDESTATKETSSPSSPSSTKSAKKTKTTNERDCYVRPSRGKGNRKNSNKKNGTAATVSSNKSGRNSTTPKATIVKEKECGRASTTTTKESTFSATKTTSKTKNTSECAESIERPSQGKSGNSRPRTRSQVSRPRTRSQTSRRHVPLEDQEKVMQKQMEAEEEEAPGMLRSSHREDPTLPGAEFNHPKPHCLDSTPIDLTSEDDDNDLDEDLEAEVAMMLEEMRK